MSQYPSAEASWILRWVVVTGACAISGAAVSWALARHLWDRWGPR